MLPTIVIGADEVTREPLMTKWREAKAQGPLWFYDTTEDAAYELADALGAVGEADEPRAEQNLDGSWGVNVLWGPNAWGPALTGRPPELAHTGWTGVFGASINPAPGKPRRMRNGEPEGAAPDTRVWQAGPLMRAHVVFDVFGAAGNGITAVRAIVERLTSRDTP
jgi:hypothetical protein